MISKIETKIKSKVVCLVADRIVAWHLIWTKENAIQLRELELLMFFFVCRDTIVIEVRDVIEFQFLPTRNKWNKKYLIEAKSLSRSMWKDG